MENKVLFICNTYMQLITAIQIKYTLLKDRPADIVISDHSVNAQAVCERVERCGLFSRVLYLRTKYIDNEQGCLADVRDVAELVFHIGKRFDDLIWEDALYETVFYYNPEPFLLHLWDENIRRGVTPKLVRYEEGLLSYPDLAGPMYFGRVMIAGWLRKLTGGDSVIERTDDFYCYYPELLPPVTGEVHRIPVLSREKKDALETLNHAFAYVPEEDTYPQRYIFFATSSDLDGNPIGETEIVLQIAELVGKENLLVKMHPRDGRDIYEKYGITVSRNSAVPWEIIQLNHDFTNHVFISISSGSVLNASAMLGDDVPTYYLYPLVKGRNREVDRSGENIDVIVAALQKTGVLQKMHIAASLEEIMKGR